VGEANIYLQQNIRQCGVEGTTNRHSKATFSLIL